MKWAGPMVVLVEVEGRVVAHLYFLLHEKLLDDGVL